MNVNDNLIEKLIKTYRMTPKEIWYPYIASMNKDDKAEYLKAWKGLSEKKKKWVLNNIEADDVKDIIFLLRAA